MSCLIETATTGFREMKVKKPHFVNSVHHYYIRIHISVIYPERITFRDLLSLIFSIIDNNVFTNPYCKFNPHRFCGDV